MIDAADGYEGDDSLVTSFPTECPGGPNNVGQVIEGPVPSYLADPALRTEFRRVAARSSGA